MPQSFCYSQCKTVFEPFDELLNRFQGGRAAEQTLAATTRGQTLGCAPKPCTEAKQSHPRVAVAAEMATGSPRGSSWHHHG